MSDEPNGMDYIDDVENTGAEQEASDRRWHTNVDRDDRGDLGPADGREDHGPAAERGYREDRDRGDRPGRPSRSGRADKFVRQGGRSVTNPWDARAWLDAHPERDFDEEGNVIARPAGRDRAAARDIRDEHGGSERGGNRSEREHDRPTERGGEGEDRSSRQTTGENRRARAYSQEEADAYRNARRGGARTGDRRRDGNGEREARDASAGREQRDGRGDDRRYRGAEEHGGWRRNARDFGDDRKDSRPGRGQRDDRRERDDWNDDHRRDRRASRDEGRERRGSEHRGAEERGGWRRNARDYQDDRDSRDDRRSFADNRRRDDDWDDDRTYDARDSYGDFDDDYDDYDDDFDDREPLGNDPYARRMVNPCPVAKRCGGCEWLSMPYEEQLARKQDMIEDLFGDYKCGVEGIMGMNDPVRYRNKVQLPFAPGWPNREGRIVPRWGIFERGSHHIVPCDDCVIEDERARPIIADVADLMPRYNIRPYDEKAGDGWLRYCLVRTARVTGEVMLTLVATSKRIPAEKAFIGALLDRHPEITTVVVNVNKERTSVILGKEERVVEGPGYIVDKLCGCKFRISSSSFYQTNPIAAEALYDIAVELADLKPSDRIGDAYCGTGTIGIVAAKKSGAHLIGIERNPDAVEDARENALINGIEDAEFIVGDAGSVFARMARAGESLDVVFMDPPRAGATQAFLANLCRLSPTRVVYISCEPKTQRHDIVQLLRNGYQIKRICPVDMFPHTDHVENIVLLERRQVSQGRDRGRSHDHSWLNADQTTSAQRGMEDEPVAEHHRPIQEPDTPTADPLANPAMGDVAAIDAPSEE